MGEPKRIMVVDDEPTILLSLSYCLRAEGVEVITCSKIEAAEEALSRYFFDLVIADIRMSGMYGIEGLQLLRYIKTVSPGTEVIIMTAYGSHEIRQEAVNRGAFYYYDKPVNIEHLINIVGELGIPVQGVHSVNRQS
jgi:DNA-binding NtrC family response regulator